MPGVEQVRDFGKGYYQVWLNKKETLLADAATTLTGAAIVGGFVRQVPTAGRTVTTDTAANIDAATNAQVGDEFRVTVFNNSAGAFAITFAAGTGVTFKPTTPSTVAQNKTAVLQFVKTGDAAYDCYFVASA